ncbi:TetR family transcriptional regulator [Lentzea sp. NBRC 105346]|uniref:TetR/AcrR family transcriptional regulator n=1 Tax=Lentzea sp. NBRC 105346 TaxID=3032205 RepID=UPI0024A40D40|nr:TetR/AcrR family transcriptional regulator [Lentzea sp. NBRC 105346]GLZ35882.1 TetR family transcriptional regulator [Lentzea sp. NBRC 105346]
MGLREDKKRATRELISGVATAMFIERGFDNVTVAEIASAANVSKMTVFNYFPRKEDLFFDRQAALQELLVELARRRPLVPALRSTLLELVEERHPYSGVREGLHHFWQVVWDSPALLARAREMNEEAQDVMAAELVADYGPIRAAVVAGAVSTAIRQLYASAMRALAGGMSVDELCPVQVRNINEVCDLLESGIG